MAHLQLDAARITSARDSARQIAQQVWREMQPFTTTTVERASLRLMGVDGVDDNQVPLPNRVVEHLQAQGLLPLGAAVVVAAAMQEQGWTAQQVAQAVGFRSEKSFARAFRDWTGESPAEYRRKGVGV